MEVAHGRPLWSGRIGVVDQPPSVNLPTTRGDDDRRDFVRCVALWQNDLLLSSASARLLPQGDRPRREE
jgi:hypothetical protein